MDCPSGYSGIKTRFCKADGTWEDVDSNSCKIITEVEESKPEIIYCPEDGEWPKTEANNVVSNICPSGYVGTQSRKCGINGTWEDIDMSNCKKEINNNMITIIIISVIALIILILIIVIVKKVKSRKSFAKINTKIFN